MRTSSVQSCTDSLGDSDAFLLGDPRGNRNHQFPGRPRRAEVLLSKTHKLNTMRSESLDVLKRFGNTFSGQAIECPYESQVESPLRCIREHTPERGAL
jgi:hypothetical protein